MEYKIFKRQYYNELGKPQNTSYIIKKRKTFFGFVIWKTVTHEECGWSGCWNDETTFTSEEAAQEFIKNILCAGVPRQKVIVTPIKEVSCIK